MGKLTKFVVGVTALIAAVTGLLGVVQQFRGAAHNRAAATLQATMAVDVTDSLRAVDLADSLAAAHTPRHARPTPVLAGSGPKTDADSLRFHAALAARIAAAGPKAQLHDTPLQAVGRAMPWAKAKSGR
jgi:hypothetical protein